MPKIRVLVVDDSTVIRRLLVKSISADPDLEVVATASDGVTGLAKIAHFNPDVVVLDIEMPTMDGLETLRALRKVRPKLPVIMFSTLTERGAAATLDALTLGASDYAAKPTNVGSMEGGMEFIRTELVPKIKRWCQRPVFLPPPQVARASGVKRPMPSGRIRIVAIGVSTGGPNALAALLPGLAAKFPVPVVIVQHMPTIFTRLLAERIDAVSGFTAREGESGMALKAGQLWVAPGGFHMEVQDATSGPVLRVHDGPSENSCRPAVDVLFRSVAKVYGAGTLAVILTGMGQDGLVGCQAISEAGGQILVQDRATSVVWGMPGVVSQAGLADAMLPLHELAGEINRRVHATEPPHSAASRVPGR